MLSNLKPLYEKGHFNYDSIPAVLISTILWTSFYNLMLHFLHPCKNPEYCDRILSISHGVVSCFIGITQCFVRDVKEMAFNHPEYKTSTIQCFVMVWSLGYFIYDFFWICKHQIQDTLMLTHHMYCILSLVRMLFKGYGGAQTACALGCMELSNPCLHLRWFIRSEGLYPSFIFTVVEFSFFIIFVLVRIILGSYYMLVIVNQKHNDLDFIMFSLSIYIISWMFIFQILRVVFKRFGIKRKVL